MIKKDGNKSDLLLLEKYLSHGKLPFYEKNKITSFEIADKVFPFTNEPIDSYYNKDLKDKKVLSVTSSGDHLLHAALAGAKDITGFDVNRFCKYYSELKVAMIKTYDYEEFISKISFLVSYLDNYDWIHDLPGLNNFEKIINEVKNYLIKDEFEFFNTFIKTGKTARITLPFFYDKPLNKSEDQMVYNAYLRKENYDLLKERLKSCNIKYLDSNLTDLNKKLDDKFDVIYLSNILSLVLKNKEKQVLSLRRLLNKNGVIYDCALFGNEFDERKIKRYYDLDWARLKDGHEITVFMKKK